MKKFLLIVVILFSVIGCFEDAIVNCPTDNYPLWCSDNKKCCPISNPYNCGGECYTTNAAAWTACGQYGGYVDVCRPE